METRQQGNVGPEPGGVRILVADDEATVRQCICEMLGSEGYAVCAAVATGEDAVENADRLQPDVVLMDVRMPGIGGIEAARRIRRLRAPAPVVFLTAFADERVVCDAARAGGYGYLVKPFHAHQLRPMIRTATERFAEWQSAHCGAGHSATIRRLLDGFAAAAYSAGIEPAFVELEAEATAWTDAEGVLVLLRSVDGGLVRVAPVDGRQPPEAVWSWAASAGSIGGTLECAVAGGDGKEFRILAAALKLAGAPEGIVAVYADAAHPIGGDWPSLLQSFAEGLAHSIESVRSQRPLTWRRWLQASADRRP